MRKGNKITPRRVASQDELCGMERDHVSAGDFWMLTDGYQVSIHEQRKGEHSKQHITIPRKVFDAFVDWYMTGTWTHPHRMKGTMK